MERMELIKELSFLLELIKKKKRTEDNMIGFSFNIRLHLPEKLVLFTLIESL